MAGMARWNIWVGFIIGGLSLAGGCSPIYTLPQGWAGSIDTSQYRTAADVSYAIAEGRARFRLDLTSCVVESDPSHLYEMNDGREYQIAGWFVSTTRTAPVRDCMIRKGWEPIPK
jgi:hypothetical protein